MMRLAGLSLILLALSTPADAQVRGQVSDCHHASCTAVARLQVVPDAEARATEHSLFVGILQLVDGAPNPAVAGWFDGGGWVAGMPKAAWTGIMRQAVPATVKIPGGVCGMVRSSGGPAGTYGLMAGWGRAETRTAGMDLAELERDIASAPPDVAIALQRTLDSYRDAQERLAKHGASAGDSGAFTNMRSRNTYWVVQQFNCAGGVE